MVTVHADSRVSKQPEEVTRSYCLGLATKISKITDLPEGCEKFKNEVMRRRDTRSASTIAFDGMRPGSAAAARSSRAMGRPTQAQVQRRYTHNNRFVKAKN